MKKERRVYCVTSTYGGALVIEDTTAQLMGVARLQGFTKLWANEGRMGWTNVRANACRKIVPIPLETDSKQLVCRLSSSCLEGKSQILHDARVLYGMMSCSLQKAQKRCDCPWRLVQAYSSRIKDVGQRSCIAKTLPQPVREEKCG